MFHINEMKASGFKDNYIRVFNGTLKTGMQIAASSSRRGLKIAQLEVTQTNDVAINLYKKIGFHVTQVIEKMPSI